MKHQRIHSPFSSRYATTIIIGAGHAGLSMSHQLEKLGIDHVILERGEVANSWKTERWDSLKLLTPNWQCKLPGFSYGKEFQGEHPDEFMSMTELHRFIEQYAATLLAPIHCGVTVNSVHLDSLGYKVTTNSGDWYCRSLVIATGAFNTPSLPGWASQIDADIVQLTSKDYKNPNQLEQGPVLVVGGSATGLQLAEEIHNSGRPVTLAMGEHVKMPRQYRGRDIFWWMEHSQIASEFIAESNDLQRLRKLPSPQLIGNNEHSIFDLNLLQDQGVKIVGRLMNANQHQFQFTGALANICQLADLKLKRLLKRFDELAVDLEVTEDPEYFPATLVASEPILSLSSKQIKTVIWATGLRPDYSWLKLPVFNHKGELKHSGGIVHSPGVYVLGLPFMRRRHSSYIHGINDDTSDLARDIQQFLCHQHKLGDSRTRTACNL